MLKKVIGVSMLLMFAAIILFLFAQNYGWRSVLLATGGALTLSFLLLGGIYFISK